MGSPVIAWQVLTPSPEKHAAFYKEAFGWTLDNNNPMGYLTARTGSSDGIPGGFWPSGPSNQAFVQLFIQVPDIDAVIARATSLGASVIMPPQTLPEGQRMAILRDPQGITFGLTTGSA